MGPTSRHEIMRAITTPICVSQLLPPSCVTKHKSVVQCCVTEHSLAPGIRLFLTPECLDWLGALVEAVVWFSSALIVLGPKTMPGLHCSVQSSTRGKPSQAHTVKASAQLTPAHVPASEAQPAKQQRKPHPKYLLNSHLIDRTVWWGCFEE